MTTRFSLRSLLAASVLLGLAPTATRAGEPPRALPPGELPADVRLQPLKDLDGYFPFTPPASRDAWEKRAERVRRQILVSLGLWPMHTRTPLQPVIHGRIERDDYTVEKVYFESVPGFFVTGNLYRPKGQATGKRPGVLCPHGHWNDGRFLDSGADGVRKEIAQGAERFEEGGRSVLQARCVGLARMGCVVFHYDMIGYADSVQISQALAHGFAKQRPEMNTAENWGLFSPQAEAHAQSIMGLQTWSSIRALDFLLGLPDMDDQRIAVTGASGGGTQTFILGAIDPRPAVAFPAVMVSTAMQGGCTCENACNLRVDTGNVEFAALFAPKPLGMTAADDWTKEMPTKGFPELKQHFALMGAPDKVMLKPLLHFGHNYNSVSRTAMYGWLNAHLKLGQREPVIERDYQRLSTPELSVWDDQHPKPPGGPEFERKLLHWLTDDTEQQLATARRSRADFERVYGGGIEVVIGRTLAEVGEVNWQAGAARNRNGVTETPGRLRAQVHGEELPAVLLQAAQGKGAAVIWLSPQGKAGLYGADGGVRPEVRALLDGGCDVFGVDLLFQGEFVTDGKAVTQARKVKNPREAAAYSFGYNRTLFAQRVQDVLTAVQFLKTRGGAGTRIAVIGVEGAGAWAAAATALAPGALQAAAIDTAGFRFGKVTDILGVDFLSGGAVYGDLPGMLAVGAPARLWLAGEGSQAPALVQEAYAATNPGRTLTLVAESGPPVATAAARWIAAWAGTP